MDSITCFALLTDFGDTDGYAGILHGVLAGFAPRIPIHDICHSIPPGDIPRAALMLWQSLPYFPTGTIFITIVDPGVGSNRLPILCHSEQAILVCPDNGLSSFTFFRGASWQVREIRNLPVAPSAPSATFHGRDIFAPAAGYLAQGADWDTFGPPVDHPCPLPRPKLNGDAQRGWEGEVMYHDHFGNAVTSIGIFSPDGCTFDPWIPECAAAGKLRSSGQTRLEDGTVIPFRGYYQESPEDRLIAIIGSSGWLEIAAPNRRAADHSALHVGARILYFPSQ
jgi:S-adenosyl-L-methionine hydrolase (adenosine-forming)